MFEAQVAAILKAQLGSYVLGLDAEALKLGIWSGEVTLQNLQVRTRKNTQQESAPRREKMSLIQAIPLERIQY